MIGTILTTEGRYTALADAWAADCRAALASARCERLHGHHRAARDYLRQARAFHRQALEIRRRMRSWPGWPDDA